ncbi:MAG: hypothetical protein ABH951_02700 [Patescibacteria group bacterium]
MKFSFEDDGESKLNKFKFNRFKKIKEDKLRESSSNSGLALSVGRKGYHPDKIKYSPIGKPIERAKNKPDVSRIKESDTEYRKYRRQIRSAESPKDLVKIGFDKYKTTPNDCIVLIDPLGHKVVFNSEGKQVFSNVI